ncbi:BadF-type ATPase [Thermanaeromonas toyohensis ToBE]|uniref:BadF-type ATPase n=1 Tax=Thermanaeromonas toyohensis ToBE TaxID=698762 RepID=A0A1W1VWY4_9FIRM|nr:BadF/BadG/BcrA/BcrD ATPase family protein [Thermanaeromonas toyohensis]SMB97404.1 BadF-type ATPase [Thermanaeromonas toyohensis ToBE]
MELFLGIEGGGTNTRAVLAQADGQILGVGWGGPSNALFVGREAASKAIKQAISQALAQKRERLKCKVIAACIPGVNKELLQLTLKPLMEWEHLILCSDTLSALQAGLGPEGVGVVVSSGTGSFAIARNKKGDIAVVGGWGPLLGDEGSGYYIGLLGLKAIIHAADGIGPPTCLTRAIIERLGLTNPLELRRVAYSGVLDRKSIAELSQVVMVMAKEGDKAALSIIKKAAWWLVVMARAVVRKAGLENEIPVVFVGGVARERVIVEIFKRYLDKLLPGAVYTPPLFPIELGSLLLAYKEGGISLKESTLHQVKTTYSSILKSI